VATLAAVVVTVKLTATLGVSNCRLRVDKVVMFVIATVAPAGMVAVTPAMNFAVSSVKAV
jgi:hypothetical protein